MRNAIVLYTNVTSSVYSVNHFQRSPHIDSELCKFFYFAASRKLCVRRNGKQSSNSPIESVTRHDRIRNLKG